MSQPALRLVEKNLEEGALGVSHSLEYQPTPIRGSPRIRKAGEEVSTDLCFFTYAIHQATKKLDGVDEAIRWGRESGAQVHIDHLHSTGGTFHMESALDKIRAANSQGLRITYLRLSLLLLGHLPLQPAVRCRLAATLWHFVWRLEGRWQQ